MTPVHNTWNLGIQLMQRIGFSAKARIILVVFMLPIALLAGAVVREYLVSRDFTEDELVGVQVLRALVPLNKHLGVLRSTLQAQVSLGNHDVDDHAAATHAVGDALTALAKQVASQPVDFKWDAELAALHGHWLAGARASDTGAQLQSLAAMAGSTQQLAQQVGDGSGLILDPDIDTLYLGLVSLQVLPAMVDNLGHIRAWSTYLARAGSKLSQAERDTARQRYAVWDAELRSSMRTYRMYAERVANYRPQVREQISPDFLAPIEAYRDQAFAATMGTGQADGDRLWADSLPVFEQANARYDVVLPLLEQLLRQRLSALHQRQWLLGLGTLASLLLAAYFFFSFYQGTVRDMRQQQLDDAALRTAKAEAEQASKAKSEFLANMSHEIRTPMNGVIGMTELAIDLASNDEQRRYLETVKSSANSLLVILNEILDFSKIEAGQLKLESIDFDFRPLLTQVLAGIEHRCFQKGLALNVVLPPPDVPLLFRGDPGRLRQVLLNLCDNAIKFTEIGGLAVSLVLESGEPGLPGGASRVRVSVADTGVGIAPDKLKAIFEAFSQADASTTRHYGGTGLGLTISARLVGLMGGQIWVDSVPGEGSTFHVQLPLGVSQRSESANLPFDAMPAAHQIEGAQTANVPLPASRPLNVLLVEDHPVNQALALALLRKWGHHVVLAENGLAAVEAFPTQRWDIVLMDMQMPVMGGLESATRIRSIELPGQRVPIVAVTANALDSDRLATFQAGMDDHLSKPFNSTALRAMLARHCGSA